MMKTLQMKLFLCFSALMLGVVAGGILLNFLLLEQYYIYKNKAVFADINRQIVALYSDDRSKVNDFLRQLDRTERINSLIVNDGREVVVSHPRLGNEARQLPREIERLIIDTGKKSDEQAVFALVKRPESKDSDVVMLSRLEGREMLVLRKSMKGINESVAIANQFYGFAGAMIICLGGIIIFFFARRVTRPIAEMSVVAGSIARLDFGKRVLYKHDDELGRLGGSINDIADKLSDSLQSLKDDVERRKQFVRNVSHELKMPIGVIKGYAEGLKFGVADDKAKIDKYCGVIAAECDRMDSMVNELLMLSRLESGVAQLQVSRFDMAQCAVVAMERLSSTFEQKGITPESDCAQMTVEADRGLIECAVNNFLANAVNHAGGEKKIRISLRKSDAHIVLEVFNSGDAVPECEQERIWDVFYKSDEARSRQYGGHGLGLAIVRSIAERHGGRVGQKNIEGGVVFFMLIPATQN